MAEVNFIAQPSNNPGVVDLLPPPPPPPAAAAATDVDGGAAPAGATKLA